MKKGNNISIVMAWVLLFINIGLFLFISYLKFFTNNDSSSNVIEHSVNDTKLSPVIIEELQTVIKYFNEDDEVKNYKDENIIIKAYLEDEDIKVSYKEQDNEEIFVFKFSTPLLTCSIDKDNLDMFKIIYRIMVNSCQKRLGNSDYDINLIDDFYNGNDVGGLVVETDDNKYTYGIDMTVKISKE